MSSRIRIRGYRSASTSGGIDI